MNSEQAERFVKSNLKPLTHSNKLARCVDGRYENIADMPLIAKPGADAGDVMVLFGGLNILQQTLPSETVLQTVIDAIGGVQNFRFHTDDHADPLVPGLGCGHIKQAKLDPTAYGLTAEQIDFLVQQLPALLEQGAVQETLHNDHAEQAVVVVDSENYGVLPLLRSESNLEEAFVYQQTLHAQQLDKIAQLTQQALAGSGKVVEEQIIRKALDDAFGKQLTETLQRLAKDLPVYTAKISAEGEVEIIT